MGLAAPVLRSDRGIDQLLVLASILLLYLDSPGNCKYRLAR